ncbi:MAG: thioredoxin family protein [Candidatus Peribacteraceae bacterium]|nr:thioredoxin family protein [Candidatus Peribacteraceae bacterium]
MSNLTITVLGSGCAKCKNLHELVQGAAKELGIQAEIEYCTDIEKIIELGAMSSPVLAINGQSVLEGSVPDMQALKQLLSEHIKE